MLFLVLLNLRRRRFVSSIARRAYQSRGITIHQRSPDPCRRPAASVQSVPVQSGRRLPLSASCRQTDFSRSNPLARQVVPTNTSYVPSHQIFGNHPLQCQFPLCRYFVFIVRRVEWRLVSTIRQSRSLPIRGDRWRWSESPPSNHQLTFGLPSIGGSSSRRPNQLLSFGGWAISRPV